MERQALANEVKNQLAKIGIQVNVLGESWDEIYTHQFEQPVLWGWGSNSPIDLYSLNYSTAWGNFSSLASAQIDANLDSALACDNEEDANKFWKLAQWDGDQGISPKGESSWAWLVSVDHPYFTLENLKLSKQKPHPHGIGWSLVNNIDQWSWN